jgi:hypothetical protein
MPLSACAAEGAMPRERTAIHHAPVKRPVFFIAASSIHLDFENWIIVVIAIATARFLVSGPNTWCADMLKAPGTTPQ